MLCRNVLFSLGLAKQPTVWISEKYLKRLAEETGWRVLWVGDEGTFKGMSQAPLFPLKYAGLSFGKEFLLEAA